MQNLCTVTKSHVTLNTSFVQITKIYSRDHDITKQSQSLFFKYKNTLKKAKN